jgi:hypothetical protein
MPLTGYNMELSKLLDSGKGYPPNYERRAHKYDHKATCDGDGRFSISGIPALNWLLITRITWKDAPVKDVKDAKDAKDDDESTAKSGWLYQEISIHENDMKITLSNENFVADKE